MIERLACEWARAGSASGVTVATNDRLQGELVRAMGVATIRASDLEAEVGGAAAESAGAAERSREVARFARRLEQRVSPEVAARLEALRRGRLRRHAAPPCEPPLKEPPSGPRY